MRRIMMVFLIINGLAVLASAEPMTVGATLAIVALGSLISAGAAGVMASMGSNDQTRKRKQEKIQFAQTMQQKDEDQAFQRMQYDDQARRSKPAETLNMLTGLANLRQGMGKPNNLDVMRRLGGGN